MNRSRFNEANSVRYCYFHIFSIHSPTQCNLHEHSREEVQLGEMAVNGVWSTGGRFPK